MTIIPVDSFPEHLVNSVVKFFRENTSVDFNSDVFNDIYDTQFVRNNLEIKEALATKNGILIPEFIATQEYVKYNNSNFVSQEKTATEKTTTKAKTFITSMNLRVLCDNKEKLGDVKLRVFQGSVRKILNAGEIVIYDFLNDIDTDLKLKWKIQDIQYVDLSEEYQEYQQGIFTISVWCDVFTEETDDILLTHDIILDPQ